MNKDAQITSLYATIAAQSKTIEQLGYRLEAQSKQLEKLHQQLEIFQRMLFGKKSEKQAKESARKDEVNSLDNRMGQGRQRQGAKPKRQALPASLPRIDVVHDLAEDEKQCGQCKQPLQRFGETVSEQIDFIPAQLIVKRHHRYKYQCRCGITHAAMPNQPIDKGLPGAGLLADVLVSKYQDAMPLYRQMLRYRRFGFHCPDSTLCDWVKECALLLEPLVQTMREDLLLAKKIHTDDTTVPVLAKGKTKTGRLWVYLADKSHQSPICLYDYTPTRHSRGPVKYLNGYQGYLQADAYHGYDCLYASKKIIEVGCMAHARRKFVDVAKAAKGDSFANDIIKIIAKFYAIEKQTLHLTTVERYYYRKRHSKPVLRALHRLVSKHHKTATPNTPFYKALQYAINHWQALCRFLADGDLSIDNNAAERAIRPLVIGRKNWLFAGSDEGGKRAAIIYSIIETCKMNGINTFEYLTDILAKIPNTLHKNIRSLLPYHWQQLRH